MAHPLRTPAALYVTDFGAQGDSLSIPSVTTVAGSSDVMCPGANFTDADIGKLIEVFGAGAWCGVSNQTLIAYITSVSSPSEVILSKPAGITAEGLAGIYGTDSAIGFNNAIAAANYPTDTIIIPEGNYLIAPREAINGYPDGVAHASAINLRRGGLTFTGQGNVVLTQSGWVRNGMSVANGSSGERGAMFMIGAPMANNYPLVFDNITFFGGESAGWIHNISFPSSDQTGLGWDMSHHALSFEYRNGGNFVDSITVRNCAFSGWRGEVLITTYASTNTFMVCSNCLFTDNNATQWNIDFAHLWTDCAAVNCDQIEEFYRSYATKPSYCRNCYFTNSGPMALNGGYPFNPPYLVSSNTFTGADWAVYTTPASDFMFLSNNVSTGHGLGIGVAGYQDEHGIDNSNIVVAFNTFNGSQYPFYIMGGGDNRTEKFYFFSNLVENAWGMGGGYGWSTNVFVFNNTGVNCRIFDEGGMSGQWFLEYSNSYTPLIINDSRTVTNIFTYAVGSLGGIQGAGSGSGFALDDSQPAKIPPGATMTVKNTSSEAWLIYTSPKYFAWQTAGLKLTAAVETNLPAGQSATFYWNNGAWQTTKPASSTSTSNKTKFNLNRINFNRGNLYKFNVNKFKLNKFTFNKSNLSKSALSQAGLNQKFLLLSYSASR